MQKLRVSLWNFHNTWTLLQLLCPQWEKIHLKSIVIYHAFVNTAIIFNYYFIYFTSGIFVLNTSTSTSINYYSSVLNIWNLFLLHFIGSHFFVVPWISENEEVHFGSLVLWDNLTKIINEWCFRCRNLVYKLF